MFYIKVAGWVIRVDNQHPEVEQFCFPYWINKEEADPVIETIRVTQEGLESCKNYFRREEQREIDDGEAEQDFMQHSLYPLLPFHGGFWLHACVVEVDGEAYAFSAPSGGGKTTHARLWLKLLGEKARIINGDNPIIRLQEGRFVAYGTPWCGKEGWQVNTGIPLKAVCYISHSEENRLERLSPLLAYSCLVRCSCQYQTRENTEAMLALYEQMTEGVPFYQMNCNMEEAAARISYEGMSGQKL